MKPSLIGLLLLGITLAASAQNEDVAEKIIKKKCRPEYIYLPLPENRQPFPPELDSIVVLDYRKDTSRIGIVTSGARGQKELLLHAPVDKQLTSWFNAGYSSRKGSHTLLIVVKNLWISDAVLANGRWLEPSFWHVAFWFEAYVKTPDGYTPLVRMDTTARVGSGGGITSVAARVLPDMLMEFMEKVAARSFDVDAIVRRTVSFEQIDSFSRVRYNYPMDTASKLVKGVYANVEEFRNNSPSITEYELSKDKSSDLSLSIPDGSGHFVYTHTMWGLCDGNQTYVMMDGNLFPIFSVHHQFYVLGSKEYTNHRIWVPVAFLIPGGAFISGLADVSENVIRSLRLFRLNEHSGRVIE